MNCLNFTAPSVRLSTNGLGIEIQDMEENKWHEILKFTNPLYYYYAHPQKEHHYRR